MRLLAAKVLVVALCEWGLAETINPYPRPTLPDGSLHPIEIEQVDADGTNIAVHVRNHGATPVSLAVGADAFTIAPGQVMPISRTVRGTTPFEDFTMDVLPKDLPALRRTVHLFHPNAATDWIILKSGAIELKVAPDGSGAVVLRGGQTAAIVAPLVSRQGLAQALSLSTGSGPIRFQGDSVSVALSVERDEIAVAIDSDQPCEGPALRALGGLQQGLFAGLEYLGRGEASSSTLDIETPEHVRFAPDPLKVTMPLMACVTERATVAVTWKDMTLQPVYASPDFFDGTADHRMSLRGTKIAATILVRDAGPVEESILWAVKKCGLPPLPAAPRSRADQDALCLAALNGPLKSDKGWGHCVEPNWQRQPFGDFASTLWRLTGEPPSLPELVPGGSHIRNDAIYFVTGRAADWLKRDRKAAENIIREQKEDGSWRYDGPYRRGHYEDTSSGLCARNAAGLLDFAWATGDRAALDAGVKALGFIGQHFHTPRGAQTWECPLHTPDILASAHLVAAFTRGYELTGNPEHLRQARRWALSGVPFVYLWGRYPIMSYATIAVYGATNWKAPNWMGLPVQWCGYVYAYALAALARHDDTLDWKQLATGILLAAEQMQCPDGPTVGCVPDSIALAAQQRNGPMINPCALVSLRRVLEGQLDSIAVATDGAHRIASPYPVILRDGQAHIGGKPGVRYQVLVDGERVVDVISRGEDVLSP